MSQRNKLVFHLGIPVSVGAVMGFNQVRMGEHLSLGMSVLFWITVSLACWVIFEAITGIAAIILRPWSPPLFLVLVVGMSIASLPTHTALYTLAHLFSPLIIDGAKPQESLPLEMTQDFALRHLRSWAGFFTFWLSTNLVAAKMFGITRFGIGLDRDDLSSKEIGPLPISAQILPNMKDARFLRRVPERLGSDLVALSSQDHYLSVQTVKGSTLILYSLSEAIQELDEVRVPGLRVHRSHWVATSHIAGVSANGRLYSINLDIGTNVPIGHTYVEHLRQLRIIQKGNILSTPSVRVSDFT